MRNLLSYFAACSLIFLPSLVVAKENTLNNSNIEEIIKKSGLPTHKETILLETKSKQLFGKGNCTKAIPVLREFQKQSNALANIISAGINPFHRASHNARKAFRGSLSEMAEFEGTANDFKRRRNAAMVMEAECLVKTGRNNAAAVKFFNALRMISIKNLTLWKRAREGLYALIKY